MEDRFSKQGEPTEERVIEDGLSELLSKVAAQRSTLQKPALSPDPKAAAAGVAAGSEKPQPNSQYIDSQDVRETFADTINSVHFDGQTLRIEFGVTRVKPSDPSNPSAPQVFQRLPACRLVLTRSVVAGLNDLMQKISAGSIKNAAGAGPAKQEK
jgi:hypothetical protein